MNVLALDTTGPDCSCALVRDGAVLALRSERIGRGHAERLAPMVEEVLAEAGCSPADIDRVAVCTGPGSFTGLRVALSFAKGFALPRDLPVVGINTLEIEAEGLRRQGDALVGVMRDIRRGEIMFALYSHGKPLDPPRAMTMAEAEELANECQAGIYEVETVDVALLGDLAATLDPADYPPDAFYSRGPDAKLPGGLMPPLSTSPPR